MAFDVVRRPCSDSGMLRRLIKCRIIIIIIIIIIIVVVVVVVVVVVLRYVTNY